MGLFRIEVDLSQLSRLSRVANPQWDIVTAAVQEATKFVRDTWVAAVSGTMLPGMSRYVYDDEYVNSLATADALQMDGPFHAYVITSYDKAASVEAGYPGFDIKPGLLNGPRAKPTQDGTGRYNTVPFRYLRNNAQYDGGPRHYPTMPPDIEQVVSKRGVYFDPGDPSLGGQRGQRSKLAIAINARGPEGEGPLMQDNYTWKTGQYERLTKTNKAGHSEYMAFRRVSTPRTKTLMSGPRAGTVIQLGSDPSSWIHPGLAPNPIQQAVADYCSSFVQSLLQQAGRKALGLD